MQTFKKYPTENSLLRLSYVTLRDVSFLHSIVLDDSTLQVQVDSVRVLDDKLQVRGNNLFVRGDYPLIS